MTVDASASLQKVAIWVAIWAAVVLALAGTFALYARPDFLVTLADHIWACF